MYSIKNMEELKEIEKIIKGIPQFDLITKTDTIAVIFDKSRNENFISDWLAYLMKINPNVVKALCLSVKTNESDAPNLKNYEFEVKREFRFSDYRIIDFLLSNKDSIIAIEHKVDSGEQNNQLKDYSNSLKGIDFINKDVYKILLKPSSNSLKTKHGFIEVTYDNFLKELKKIPIDFITDLRGSFLLLDFIKHIEENLIMENQNKFEYNDWTIFISSYQEQINKINESMKNEIKNINTYIRDRVLSLISDQDNWILERNKSTEYIQLFKNDWNTEEAEGMPYTHFELLFNNAKTLPTSCCIRLDIEGGDEEKRLLIFEQLGKELKICEKSNKNEILIILEEMKINYSDSESFYKSIDKLMESFKKHVNIWTPKIDNAIEQIKGK